MAIDGEPVDDATLDELLRAAELVEREVGIEASYFEILVAIALRWFADEAVDVCVAEVGMGGTWDATNVVDGARRGSHERQRSTTSSTSVRRASRSRPRRRAS